RAGSALQHEAVANEALANEVKALRSDVAGLPVPGDPYRSVRAGEILSQKLAAAESVLEKQRTVLGLPSIRPPGGGPGGRGGGGGAAGEGGGSAPGEGSAGAPELEAAPELPEA